MKCIFASKAVVGEKYLSKNGMPVTILEVVPKATKVLSDLTGNEVKLYPGDILFPYQPSKINKEAITMANAMKAAKGNTERKGLTSIEKTEGGKFVVVKNVKGKPHKVTINGKFTYEGKTYDTLQAIVCEIIGKDYEYEGFGFFGLRNPSNKAALEAARKILKAHRADKKATRKVSPKAPKSAKKAPKTRRVKVHDEEENTPLKSTPSESAAISAKGGTR